MVNLITNTGFPEEWRGLLCEKQRLYFDLGRPGRAHALLPV